MLIVAVLPNFPGTLPGSLLMSLLIVVFGFFFVTVASRIVGIIGTSSNPVSGMTIATLMATCLLFVGIGWTGDVYQPMALCVGGMVCIAAANAGATSQDLKTGFLVGATPRLQQIGLLIGVVVAALVIGFTIKVLDNPTLDAATGVVTHAIGSDKYPAPQGTLMATLIRGLLAHNLDWQFVLVGVFLAVTVELCGVSPLSFAVGAYLPLSTTLPIWVGGEGKAAMRRSARYGDAWFPYYVCITPAELRARHDEIRRLAREYGRDPDSVALTACAAVQLTEEPVPQESDRLRGTPEQVAAALGEYESAGVEHVALQFMVPKWPERKEQIARFAEEALPLLRAGATSA